MAEGTTCATDCPQLACGGDPYFGATLIQTSPGANDFTLVRLGTNLSCTYGYVPLRSTGAVGNERMYIPNHSAGKGKRIAVFSTDPADESGYCEVGGVSVPINCAGFPGNDVTYKADTEGGSSGSPVVAYSDQRAIALHHCSLGAPCGSSGGTITDIITLLGANLPPGALIDRVGEVKLDATSYGCTDSGTVEVKDESHAGAGTQLITLVSAGEPGGEPLNLVETPPNSGHFQGNFLTNVTAPSSGDGTISVQTTDTITAQYTDADSGPACGPVVRTSQATIDCAGPVITNVHVANLQGGFADIAWTTNEPATSVVTSGRASTPPPTTVTSDATPVILHQVRVAGLESCTGYVYKVQSSDIHANGTQSDNGGANYSFTTLYEVSPSFAYVGPAVPVPDNDGTGATASVQVPDAGTVLDVNVKLSVSHPRDGDLLMYLIGPDATQTVLIGLRGGTSANFTNTVLNDEAASPIATGSAPFTGTFRPEQPLAAFQGRPAAGTWTLRVSDQAAGNVGSIVGFEVEITYASRPCYNDARSRPRAGPGRLRDRGGERQRHLGSR
jgi:subtilisin-like proprotein convertase family protein